MKINITQIANLLDSNLTLQQRGLLITILLVKDTSPKFTLAKLKSVIKVTEYHQDLISLHDSGYIDWSGYASAKRQRKKAEMNPDVFEVIDFMNSLYKRSFNKNSESSTKELRNRLAEHSIEDVKRVVTNRYAEWNEDAVMCKHLNPTTIFRASKFEKYLEEANRTKVGQSYLTVDRLQMKHADEFTFEMYGNILDKDIYAIKTYDVDPQGVKITSGMLSKVYGSNLKKMLKAQNNKIQNGYPKDSVFIYQEL